MTVKQETAQLQAKVALYADERIGELLSELPKGKRGPKDNSPTAVGEISKGQAIKDAGISKGMADKLQKLAAHPDVVEETIAKAEEEGKVFWGKRFRSKPRIHIWSCGSVVIDCGTRSISAGRLQIGFRTQGAK